MYCLFKRLQTVLTFKFITRLMFYYYYQSTYCTVDTQKQLQIVFCPIVTRGSLYLKASVIYPRNASFQLNSSLIS